MPGPDRDPGEGVAMTAEAGDPRGCAHPKYLLSALCWPLGKEDLVTGTQHVGSRFPPGVTDVRVYSALCPGKPTEKKHSWLMKSFRGDKEES